MVWEQLHESRPIETLNRRWSFSISNSLTLEIDSFSKYFFNIRRVDLPSDIVQTPSDTRNGTAVAHPEALTLGGSANFSCAYVFDPNMNNARIMDDKKIIFLFFIIYGLMNIVTWVKLQTNIIGYC